VSQRYTAKDVRAATEADIDRLFAPWAVGRPEGWIPCEATKVLVALGYWLRDELVRLGANEADVRTQTWKFNRLSRTYDVWQSAADCLNDALDGVVEQNRRGHRRWG
jgi:hypothetical protein